MSENSRMLPDFCKSDGNSEKKSGAGKPFPIMWHYHYRNQRALDMGRKP
jgi:hypothetical protein